MTTDPSGLPSD
jgi:hypothetical protein